MNISLCPVCNEWKEAGGGICSECLEEEKAFLEQMERDERGEEMGRLVEMKCGLCHLTYDVEAAELPYLEHDYCPACVQKEHELAQEMEEMFKRIEGGEDETD